MAKRTLDQKMNIVSIVWPIFIESLIRMTMMSVDVLMLSRYSEDAVAAVGLTGHFIFFLVITFMVVSSGTGILMGQNLGARKFDEARNVSHAGAMLAILIWLVVATGFFFGSSAVVSLYDLEAQVAVYAKQYLLTVGSLSVGMAVGILMSTILRAHGYSKSPMIIQLISGLLNVIGNYIALFGPFGIPETGVAGVALATVFAQVFSAVAGFAVIKYHKIPFSFRASLKWDGRRLLAILKLGAPNAGEGLAYNLAQIVIMFFVAQLGTTALAAAAIGMTIARFMFVFPMALGGGSQIQAAYFIGQNRQDELKRKVNTYWMVGMAVAITVAGSMVLARHQIAEFFSSDPDTQLLVATLMLVSLFLEPGRSINLIVIATLKGTGDVVFPVKMGIVSMWGIGVLMAWFLGIHLGWGMVGIWLGVAFDEWTRGIVMIFRWQSEVWKRFRQVSADDEEATAEPAP